MFREEILIDSADKNDTNIEEYSYCQFDTQNPNQTAERQISTPNGSNDNLIQQSSFEIDDDILRIVNNQKVKKSIAKLSKSQSKKYTKKKMVIVPCWTLVKEISQDYLITLYGCLEVETNYRDYDDPFDNNLILYVERMHTPVSITKDLQLSVVDVVQSPLSTSGIEDFQFLIDRYIKMQNQDYLELAQELSVYQYIVTNHLIPQISIQKAKMSKSAKKREDFAQAQEKFVKYFKNYVKENLDPSAFYDYELYRTNYVTGEIELFRSGFSFSLCSLLGVEVAQIDNLVFRGQNYFSEQVGNFRLKFCHHILSSLNNEIKQADPFPYILRTYDGLVIHCKLIIQQVTYDERPSWIEPYDLYGIIFRFDVNVQQIRAILDIRSKQSNLDLESNTVSAPYAVEYQMYSEVFLEKFYPQLFTNDQIEDDKSKSNRSNKKIEKKGIVLK